MSGEKEKPFYLRQPWDVLFKQSKLDKVSPWSIDLVALLATLLEEMNKAGIDFRIAGTAINSSVYIYLRKAELLLEMEEPPKPPEDGQDVYVPPPVPLPFRFEFTTTSISDLITALEKALEEEGSKVAKPKLPTLPVPIPDFLDAEQYLLEIEAHADDLLEEIRANYAVRGRFSIYELVGGLDLLGVVRVFMMLLFLAQRMEIDLEQDEEETNIWITLKEEYPSETQIGEER